MAFRWRPGGRVSGRQRALAALDTSCNLLNMALSLGQRDHKEVAARYLGNRSSLVHDDELFLGQHHLVRVKQGLGRFELNALEWRCI